MTTETTDQDIKEIDDLVFPMKPSPKDKRDLVLECLNNVRANHGTDRDLPEVLDLREYLPPPRNQGKRGTCAAFSAACIKEFQEKLDVNYSDYMSPESVYFYRRNQDSQGMHARDVMKILYNHGIAPEKYFPYNPSGEPDEVPEMAKSVMENFVIRHYARIKTLHGVKKALRYYGPLLICVPVYRNSPTIWKPRYKGDKLRGGHAMVIVGYNQEGLIIRNSWGSHWNGDGNVIMPYQDFGCQWEIWSAIDDLSPELSDDLKGDQDNNSHGSRRKLSRFLRRFFPCLFKTKLY